METAKKIIKDPEIKSLFEHVFQNAFGLPIIFSSAPSLAEMKAQSWGVAGTDLYIKFGNNSAIKISGTAVT